MTQDEAMAFLHSVLDEHMLLRKVADARLKKIVDAPGEVKKDTKKGKVG